MDKHALLLRRETSVHSFLIFVNYHLYEKDIEDSLYLNTALRSIALGLGSNYQAPDRISIY